MPDIQKLAEDAREKILTLVVKGSGCRCITCMRKWDGVTEIIAKAIQEAVGNT